MANDKITQFIQRYSQLSQSMGKSAQRVAQSKCERLVQDLVPQDLSASARIEKQLEAHHKQTGDQLRMSIATMARSAEAPELVKKVMHTPNQPMAYSVMMDMEPGALTKVFPQLVELASYSHPFQAGAEDLIAKLPQDWVSANLRSAIMPLVEHANVDAHDYEGCILFASKLDPAIASEIATKASQSSDAETRAIGRKYLRKK